MLLTHYLNFGQNNQVNRYISKVRVHWLRSMLTTLTTIPAGITRWTCTTVNPGKLVQVNVTYPDFNFGQYNQVNRYISKVQIHWWRSMLLTLTTISAGITRWTGTTVRSGYTGTASSILARVTLTLIHNYRINISHHIYVNTKK